MELVRTIVIVNWLIHCQTHFTCNLVDLDGFSTSRNKSSNLVLKSCKYVQETSEEVLFIKTRQIISIEV